MSYGDPHPSFNRKERRDAEASATRSRSSSARLQRVLTTPYPVAQTPKETIWTLNKARLYHLFQWRHQNSAILFRYCWSLR